MASQLLTSLAHQPSSYLDSDSTTYDGSITSSQFYFNAIAGAEAIAHNVYITGFDVDQIWMQSQVLLHAIKKTAYRSSAPEADTGAERPKKRTRHRKQPSHSAFPDLECPESPRADCRSPDGTDDSCPESTGSEVGSSHLETSREAAKFSSLPSKTRGGENGLDDGFFSIDAFNLETERFEQADEVGESFGGLDTTIDWHANFDEEDDAGLDSDSSTDANRTVMYTDFFLPPKGRSRPLDGDTNALRNIRSQDEEIRLIDDNEALLDEIKRDLFDKAPLSLEFDDQSSRSDISRDMNLSSHRNDQARLSGRIRELEKQNIKQQEWTLSGETNSKQRPFNSLLQEDLDFERIGKPVPIVTQDSTTTLEDMIKGRILTGRFDELLRRNPENYEKSRRPAVELEDSKSRIGLAEVYEKEHLEQVAPVQGKSLDMKQNALKSEIVGLFSTVSNQLDMLSSWHFTPKRAQPALSVAQDVRTLDLEEAQVNSNHLSGPTSAALAPQEIYNPSTKAHQSDGVIKISGIPVSLSEAKRGSTTRKKGRKNHTSDSSKTGSHDGNFAVLKTLQKADVAVIGRDGQQVSLGSSRTGKITSSGSRIKL
ncbi:U3 snoRNP protein [Orbilia blumenaviensis]|uniref:U3 snoRNP protein n=1 Tax=Orbilia blumenaviensis TaxID=1796055 RepID=A0AAV9U5Y5_9PEZI